MNSTIGSLAGAGCALVAASIAVTHPAAQQQTAPAQPQVVTTYRPVGKRVSPQDGFASQQRSAAPTPRDENGHPDLSGNWGANFPSPLGAPGLREKGTFEPDQAVMQRGAQ